MQIVKFRRVVLLFFISAACVCWAPQVHAQSVPFRFVVWGDTKTATDTLAQLSNKAKTLNPIFTLYSGDLEDKGFTFSGMTTWKNAMNGNSNNGMSDRLIPVRGNHDASDASGWQTFFDVGGNIAKVGGTHYSYLQDDLTYSFDYGNSHFIGVDVLGDAVKIDQGEIDWIDRDLTQAESRGLTHAFIYFHGPIYCTGGHCSCSTLTGCVGAIVLNLVKVIEKHPIVTATFHGHEHTLAYIHIDNKRIPEMASGHSFEEFVSGSAGAGPLGCNANRSDYCLSQNGFMTVDISGPSMTVSVYTSGGTASVKSFTFTKNSGSLTPIPTITAVPSPTPGGQPTATLAPSSTPYFTPTGTPLTPTTLPTIPTSAPSPTPQGPTPTPSPVPTISAGCAAFQNGDADCNNSVDIADYVCWAYDFLSLSKPSSLNCQGSDFDKDGATSLKDYILWYLHMK